MGKFDYVPQVLDEIGVEKLFHKVKQRPGKPFWFRTYENEKLVFAFPRNPVSVYMCLHRYFIPWLETSLGFPDTFLAFYYALRDCIKSLSALLLSLWNHLANSNLWGS